MTKKFNLHMLIVCRMTFEFEYLSEFKFTCEKNLWSGSGDQMGSFDEKKTEEKNLVQVYL